MSEEYNPNKKSNYKSIVFEKIGKNNEYCSIIEFNEIGIKLEEIKEIIEHIKQNLDDYIFYTEFPEEYKYKIVLDDPNAEVIGDFVMACPDAVEIIELDKIDPRVVIDEMLVKYSGDIKEIKMTVGKVAWLISNPTKKADSINILAESLIIDDLTLENVELFSPTSNMESEFEVVKYHYFRRVSLNLCTPFYYVLKGKYFTKTGDEYNLRFDIIEYLIKKPYKMNIKGDDCYFYEISYLISGDVKKDEYCVDYDDEYGDSFYYKQNYINRGYYYYVGYKENGINIKGKNNEIIADKMGMIPWYAYKEYTGTYDGYVINDQIFYSYIDENLKIINECSKKELVYSFVSVDNKELVDAVENANNFFLNKKIYALDKAYFCMSKDSKLIKEILKNYTKHQENWSFWIERENDGVLRNNIIALSDDKKCKCEIYLNRIEGKCEKISFEFPRYKYIFENNVFNKRIRIERIDNIYDDVLKRIKKEKEDDIVYEQDNDVIEKCEDRLNNDPDIDALKEELYKIQIYKIKDLIDNDFKDNYNSYSGELTKIFKDILANNEPKLEISDQVAKEFILPFAGWLKVMYISQKKNQSIRSLLREYRGNSYDDLPIPWLCIMGEAGTGKTTFARKLARECLDANFLETTGGSLKGAYVGQTSSNVAKLINQLQTQGGKNINDPAVLFIDEAYTLFESNDSYAREVIEIILGIATADAEGYTINIAKDDVRDENGKVLTKLKVNKNTVIWLGGYEDRLRKSFSTNEGLSRRFSNQIVIPSPKREDLNNRIIKELDDINGKNSKKRKNSKDMLDEEEKTMINEFLVWATSRSKSAYFGNYAGANRIIDIYGKHIELGYGKHEALKSTLEKIKDDISRQYHGELIKNLGKLPFEVINDVPQTIHNDYVGQALLKKEICEVVDMLVEPELYRKRHIRVPKGALLTGPPGSGKSYIARCMAGELSSKLKELSVQSESDSDIAFIPISASEILGYNNPIDTIKLLFAEASKYDAAIIFLDEIDAIGKSRKLSNGNVSALTQLLTEMDGFDNSGTVFVLAATNEPDILDAAIKREGRFDLIFDVKYPDMADSFELIKMYLKKYGLIIEEESYQTYCSMKDEPHPPTKEPNEDGSIPLSIDQIERFMDILAYHSPANIESMINKAAILYYRTENCISVLNENIPFDRIAIEHRRIANGGDKKENYCHSEGFDKESERITDVECFLRDLKETCDIRRDGYRRSDSYDKTKIDKTVNDDGPYATAVHEIGHAIVYIALFNDVGFEKITTLGRGNAAGYVEPASNKRLYTKKDFENSIMVSMGGKAAEELIFGSPALGASADIENATRTVKNMVENWGFGEKTGFMSAKYASPGLIAKMEDEEMKILHECYKKTEEILKCYKYVIKALADVVIDKREMSGDDFFDEFKKICEKQGMTL